MIFLLILISILLFGIFSGVEIVFTSGRFLNYKTNEFNHNTKKIADQYSERSTIILVSCLIIKLLTLGIVSFYIVQQSFELISNWPSTDWIAKLTTISILISLSFIMILLEFLPKSLSRLYSESIIPPTSSILLYMFKVLHYPSAIVREISNTLLKTLNIPTKSVKIEYTALDIEKLIQEHQTYNDELEAQVDTELFGNVLLLKNIKVRECMVPRNEIAAIDINGGIDQLKNIIIETNHSRILVYDETIDNIVGYVHHFDLHKHPMNIKNIIIPIEIVPEAMTLQVLLNNLVSDNKSIAWVVDEYGGTAGVVTLEDALEEIFGEIEDEYDDNEYVEKQLSENEFILSGRLEIDRINEDYGLQIPEGESETLSGLIVNHTANIPEENEVIQIENFHFKILNVSETKIETLKLTVEEVSNTEQ